MLKIRRFLAGVLSAALVTTSFVGPAQAGMIGSTALLNADQRAAHEATVTAFLEREQVADQLIEWGVDATAAETRVAALSDAELADLADRIETAPAGAGIIEVVGIVFVVLLVLELVGVTDIFTSF